jgi:hypothetical protein
MLNISGSESKTSLVSNAFGVDLAELTLRRILRVLENHPQTKRAVSKRCHASRPGYGGPQMFNEAWNSLIQSGEVVLLGKSGKKILFRILGD